MKVLNLYAGVGGNRKLWDHVEVTAIENDIDTAKAYHSFFPDDEVIVADAHEFLKKNYNSFDFIWSSPPCATHAQIRYKLGYLKEKANAVYPDMRLYQEIIFLQYYFKGKWVVENTKSFYNPLIKPKEIDRHYIWSNFHIPNMDIDQPVRHGTVEDREEALGIKLYDHYFPDKRTILRNCVHPELGKHILDCARKNIQTTLVK